MRKNPLLQDREDNKTAQASSHLLRYTEQVAVYEMRPVTVQLRWSHRLAKSQSRLKGHIRNGNGTEFCVVQLGRESRCCRLA
jgi:hypothetical protein